MILVYMYGLLAPIENADLVCAQMRNRHVYRNKLTEIERVRRSSIRALATERGEGPLLATYHEADEACRTIASKISEHKSKERTRSVPEELTKQFSDASAIRKQAAKEIYALRKVVRNDPVVKAATDEINERALAARTAARAECDTYWGSYLTVEAAEAQARKTPLYGEPDPSDPSRKRYVGVEPNDPGFVRWKREGAVAVQLQGGLTTLELAVGDDTQIRIEPPAPCGVSSEPPPGWGSSRYTAEEKRARWARVCAHGAPRPLGMLRMRVQSDDRRRPVWAAWPLIQHRPLPADAVVKWAHVHVNKIGPREEWYVTLTIETNILRSRCGKGAVSIDLAWRAMDDGSMRVAVATDEQGRSEELSLSPEMLEGLRKADGIRSVRDKHFDFAREWFREILDVTPNVPEWLIEATQTMGAWKSQARLAAVAIRWRSARFDGDADAFIALDTWRQKDKHLWCYEAGQRSGALRCRKDFYRVFAARLARRYDTVVLEQFDLRAFATRPKPGEVVEPRSEKARAQRHLVAPSKLRMAIEQAFLTRGGMVDAVPAQFTTMRCSVCGVVEKFDAGAELNHTCANGHEWDQDENAGRNLLQRRTVVAPSPSPSPPPSPSSPGDAPNAGPAREDKEVSKNVKVGKKDWAAAKRLGAERRARIISAREAAPKKTK